MANSPKNNSNRKSTSTKSKVTKASTSNSRAKSPAKSQKAATANSKKTGTSKAKNAAPEVPVITETQGYSGSKRTNTLVNSRALDRAHYAAEQSSATNARRQPASGGSANRRTGAHSKRANQSARAAAAGQSNKKTTRGARAGASRSAMRAPMQIGPQSAHKGAATTSAGVPGRISVETSGTGTTSSFFSDKRRIVGLAIIVVLVVLALSVILNPKIYSGVKVGDVDVSGLTREEAATKLSDYYESRLQNAQVTVYAGEAGRNATLAGETVAPDEPEQLGILDSDGNVCYWSVDKTALGAYIDYNAYAEAAYQVGRDDGGILTRIGSFFFGTTKELTCSFGDIQLESFASVVDAALGDPRIDWNIQVVDGEATTVEGKDGQLANRDTLKAQFSNSFLSENSAQESFTATVENAPVRIDEEAAQEVADAVTADIADGAQITYGSDSWTCDASDLGSYIATTVKQVGNAWKLVPYIDQSAFSSEFFKHVTMTTTNANLQVTFESDGTNVAVHTNGEGTMPEVSQARDDLDKALFESNTAPADGTPVSITVNSGPVPETLTFDEALASHVITQVSTYTTEFTTTSGTEARNTNIAIGASYINNTVCKAGGEDWSFNGYVGDTTPDKGYQAAGSIAAGEYVDTYGGGICQVATTVFNALFESPYKIVKRYNHSLYIWSYPTGRDAAIAWDMLDLTWRNESSSDVLMKAEVGTGEITVSLYSVPVQFKVTSETGDWEEGDKYSITVEYDDNLAKGYSYVKQNGVDGSKITVTRNVYDANGNLTYTNVFSSTYKAKDEIIVAGPGTEVDTERKDTDTSSS